MKMRSRLVLDATLLVLFVVAMNTALTGIPIHEWLSVGVAILVVVHLLTEWDWTINAFTRFFKRLAALSRVNLVVDTALFVAFSLVMLSGFLVSESILPGLGLEIPRGPTWRIIHSLSAQLGLMLLGIHLGFHWRWFVKAITRAGRPSVAREAG